jgi:hypothetical protein
MPSNDPVPDWTTVQIQLEFEDSVTPRYKGSRKICKWCLKESSNNITDIWISRDNTGVPLAAIATRVFSTLANSVPAERSFSTTNFIHSRVRNRLLPETTNMAAFIYINSRVLQRIQQNTGQEVHGDH